MLFWVAIFAFGLPLVYAIFDNKRHKRDLERQLEIVQKKIAQKEQRAAKQELKAGHSEENIKSKEEF